jgi:hypothetical protein
MVLKGKLMLAGTLRLLIVKELTEASFGAKPKLAKLLITNRQPSRIGVAIANNQLVELIATRSMEA